MTFKLHDYQLRAVEHLHSHDRAALFLDMGLGKTASTLTALTPDRLPALVTAPKKVAERVWEAERKRWRPDLSMAVAAGTPAKRAAALRSGADVVVIGRDNLGDVRPGGWSTVVLDELSGFKTRGSQRWKAARKLTKEARHVWGLTGTPSPNGYVDLWAQLALLDEGKRLGRTLGGFRDRYFTPGWTTPSGVVTKWHPRPGAMRRIDELLEDIALSMQAADYLKLPPTVVNDVLVEMPAHARGLYRLMKSDLVVDLSLIYGLEAVYSASSLAALSNRLVQLTAGFMYSDTTGAAGWVHDAKLEALQDIVDGTGSPVLVFYQYREELARVLARFPEARTIDSPGALDAWDEGKLPMLVAHPASAGHGLNLQHGGHTMVFLTLPWSLELYQQASARLNRQGQRHPVVIHRLIVPGTVDALIAEALQTKGDVQDSLLRHLARA